MATVFQDTFTDTDGTTLNTHTPDVGGSWVYDATDWAIDSNQAHLTASAQKWALNDSGPGDDAYTVSADFFIASIPVVDTLAWGVISHGGLPGGTQSGYYAIFRAISSALEVDLSFQDLGGGGSLTTPITTDFAVGDSGNITLQSALISGTNYQLDVLVTRASDGNYLKPDGTWQAGAISCISLASDRAGLTPTPGVGGLFAYDFGSSSTGLQFDNFSVDGTVTGPATTYTLSGDSTADTNETILITVDPDGLADGISITFDDGGAGGTFTPNPKTFAFGASPMFTSYQCPGTPQTVTISTTNDGGLTDPASIDVVVSAGLFNVGDLFQFPGDQNAVIYSSPPTGGTAPYQRTLYRYDFYSGIPVTLGTQTSSSVIIWEDPTAPHGITSWYSEIAIDQDGAGFPSQSAFCPATYWLAKRTVLLIGDSNTANGYQYAALQIQEASARGPRQVIYVNQGISSATATSYYTDHLADAITAGNLVSCNIAYVMLGTNTEDPSTYTTSMQGICDALVGEGYQVLLFGAPYTSSLGDTWNANIIQQRQILASIADGVNVFWMNDIVNSIVATSYAAGETNMLSDGVHYTVAGGARAAMGMYQAIDQLLYPDSGGGGDGVILYAAE